MAHDILAQVIQLVDQLSPAEREQVVRHIQTNAIDREAILAEHRRRVAAGAFQSVESLRNRFSHPNFELSEEELTAGIREFANEWEQDLDDLA